MASSQSRWINSHSSQVPKSPKSRTNALLLLPDHSRVTSTKHPFPCQPYLHLHFPLGTRTQLFLSSISQLALCKIHLETTTWAPTSLLSLVVSSFPSRRLRLLSPRELLSTTETDPSPLPYQTDRQTDAFLSSPRRLVSFESLATKLRGRLPLSFIVEFCGISFLLPLHHGSGRQLPPGRGAPHPAGR